MMNKCIARYVGHPGAPWLDAYVLAVTAASIIGFLSLRGVTNASLLLLLAPTLAAAGSIRRDARECGSNTAMGWMCIALALPIVSVLIGQALRGDWIAKAYDAPSRILLSIAVLFYFRYKRIDFARLIGVVAPVALLILVAEVKLDPRATVMWQGRFATYFVDTDMFGVYALILAMFSLFGIEPGQSRPARALSIVGVVTGLYLVVGSQTRTAYLLIPIVAALWLWLKRPSISVKHLVALATLGIATIAIVLSLHGEASTRIVSIYSELEMWLNGSNRDTSGGVRLTMWQMAWELFLQSPWHGYGDTGFRAYLSEPGISALASQGARHFIFAGPHNELLANMLRSGIAGAVAVVALFAVPIATFWRARRYSPRVRLAADMGLALTICLMLAGIAFEMFTLKYTATFNGLLIAGLAGQVLAERRQSDGPAGQ
ncbi:O-antigen ligase family protein [Burkholderia ubonensis]|uniref:O-antigen ligase family protein n=1 Tax=Burkholderia ubonensis TaxID=101571 RepID=UPI000A3DC013|nr:O-antigen ligase family protein [Burkholderia ubonensis]MDY7790359.1 O-antigen ligase family protein [Burkholderia ubonensis]